VRTVDWVAAATVAVVLTVGGGVVLGAMPGLWGSVDGTVPVSATASAPAASDAGRTEESSATPLPGGRPSAGAPSRRSGSPSSAQSPADPSLGPSGGDRGARRSPGVRRPDASREEPGDRAARKGGAEAAQPVPGPAPGPAPTAPPWAAGPPTAGPVDFVVSSFNVLGSSHTRGPHARKGFAPGSVRARSAAQLLLDHRVEVVGFQEMQRDQMAVIDRATNGRYAMFPGLSASERESVNSVGWDVTRWDVVDSELVSIPYFEGRPRLMPVVRLRSRANGAQMWVGNFHNPASPPGRGQNEAWREEATRREIALANRLHAEHGIPVVFTGDFNEREDVFCAMVAQTMLVAANGGSADGPCRPPSRMDVDWVFGSQVQWLSHLSDRSSAVRRTTDHPMIVATGRLQPQPSAAAREAERALRRSAALDD